MKLPLVDLIELVKTFQICVNSHFSHVGSNIYSKSGKYCPCSLSDFTTFIIIYQVICWCYLHMAMQWWHPSCLYFFYLCRSWFPEKYGEPQAFPSSFFSVVSVLLFSWLSDSLILCHKIFLFIFYVLFGGCCCFAELVSGKVIKLLDSWWS